MCVEKGKSGERYMFGVSYIVSTRFDFEVSSKYENILSKL